MKIFPHPGGAIPVTGLVRAGAPIANRRAIFAGHVPAINFQPANFMTSTSLFSRPLTHTIYSIFLATIICTVQSFAGEPTATKQPIVLEETPPLPPLFKATIDTRLRYEFGEVDGLKGAYAETLRNRIGLITRNVAGFQLFTEYEGTLAADRNSYNAATVHGPANRTIIADPESHELNQLWLSYADPGGLFSLKVGRQGINLGNQRFVGTVGWRQNMQTFDATSFVLTPTEAIELSYAYVAQVNRIFGSDIEAAPLTDFTGNSHLINATLKTLPFGTLNVYAYLLDLHNDAGDTNSNNTFGASLSGNVFATPLGYYTEYAHQSEAYDSPLDYSAHYAHGALSLPLLEGVKATVGLEYLGSNNDVGFKTPLATLHKFNGFADVFLNTPAGGLIDAYASVSTKLPFGLATSVFYHQFQDDDFGTSIGNEVDLVVAKELGRGVTVLAKGAYFDGARGADVTRASIELSFKY